MKSIAAIVAFGLLFIAFYVLSVGPFVWLFARGYIAEGTGGSFYRPLVIAESSSPRFEGLMADYKQWWFRLGVQ